MPFFGSTLERPSSGQSLEYAKLKYAMGEQMVGANLQEKIEFQHQRQVRWAETCAAGDVHFSQWLRYMEEAEYAFLRSRGLSVVLADERGKIGFPRIACQLDLHGSASAGQLLTTRLVLERNDGKQLRYVFTIFRGAELLAEGRFIVACCRFPGEDLPFAILIPDWVMAKLAAN